MVKGLDENCQVGQGNNFYVSGNTVKTWLGTVLGEATKKRSTFGNHDFMSGERAKKILQSLLNELSGIDEEDMTTFELGLLRKCATEPPKRYYGAENQINNASKWE